MNAHHAAKLSHTGALGLLTVKQTAFLTVPAEETEARGSESRDDFPKISEPKGRQSCDQPQVCVPSAPFAPEQHWVASNALNSPFPKASSPL